MDQGLVRVDPALDALIGNLWNLNAKSRAFIYGLFRLIFLLQASPNFAKILG
jgi:hypothetical protein